MRVKKILLLLILNLVSLFAVSQTIIKIKRDPENRKDYANVFFKTQYTLFDLWSDEPIFPDENEIYHIYIATNENKTPKEFNGTAYELSTHIAYKFINYENCKNWCDGVTYEKKHIKFLEPELVSNSYSNDNVNEQQKGCVSGDCINGYGTYIWNEGDKYEGYFVNNNQQGFGIYYFNNGDKYEGDFVSGVKQGQGKYTYASGIIKEGKWVNDAFISSNTNNYKVAQDNDEEKLESEKNERLMKYFGITTQSFIDSGAATLSKSGTNINGERCKKCNIVLKTPNNRACYICNKRFSGWGFRKDYYGITTEHKESLTPCYPYIGSHNYKDWTIYENTCCSRQCAMKL